MKQSTVLIAVLLLGVLALSAWAETSEVDAESETMMELFENEKMYNQHGWGRWNWGWGRRNNNNNNRNNNNRNNNRGNNRKSVQRQAAKAQNKVVSAVKKQTAALKSNVKKSLKKVARKVKKVVNQVKRAAAKKVAQIKKKLSPKHLKSLRSKGKAAARKLRAAKMALASATTDAERAAAHHALKAARKQAKKAAKALRKHKLRVAAHKVVKSLKIQHTSLTEKQVRKIVREALAEVMDKWHARMQAAKRVVVVKKPKRVVRKVADDSDLKQLEKINERLQQLTMESESDWMKVAQHDEEHKVVRVKKFSSKKARRAAEEDADF